MTKRIYIAGPIAGRTREQAEDHFSRAAARLIADGWHPVNPFTVQPYQHDGPCPEGPSAGEGGEHLAPCYMRGDLTAMLTCDAIYMLTGWELSSGARTEFEAARAAGLVIHYEAAGIDVRALDRQRAFSERTFGPGSRTLGVIDHIRLELKEIEDDPTSLEEWIDVAILALDGAWRAGHSSADIIAMYHAKRARSEKRTYPDWRTMSADRAIEHDRSQDGAA